MRPTHVGDHIWLWVFVFEGYVIPYPACSPETALKDAAQYYAKHIRRRIRKEVGPAWHTAPPKTQPVHISIFSTGLRVCLSHIYPPKDFPHIILTCKDSFPSEHTFQYILHSSKVDRALLYETCLFMYMLQAWKTIEFNDTTFIAPLPVLYVGPTPIPRRIPHTMTVFAHKGIPPELCDPKTVD
jgi:hypothetical protein